MNGNVLAPIRVIRAIRGPDFRGPAHRGADFGRKRPPSDARRTVLGRKMPQAVIAPSCAVYSSSGAIGKSSDGSDAKSRNTW